MYRWWVFVHIVGVFAFLIVHGVSMWALFAIRDERDPKRVAELLDVSASSIPPLYGSLLVLLTGGVVAGFLGDWWSRAWIWTSLGLLVAISAAMYVLARPHFRRLRTVARAMAGGSSAVTDEQLGQLRRAPVTLWVAGIGVGGLLAILYLMMFKPSLGFGGAVAPTDVAGDVTVSANNLRFDQERLMVPAGRPFTIVFENREGVLHDVAIAEDPSLSNLLFDGEDVAGPRTVTYRVPALAAGEYVFVCTIHPVQMTGTVVAEEG